ncbi:hypothetical protein [Tenacibaculum aestuariivivum]|uniref:hypothetical protein n=1 Tax=Tenacibaculum aestuariivivum TaxID=2006131 RepID=UPI003AB83C93
MNKIKRTIIFNQFKKDLIGKDSHRGVTLTYSWMANQFGHIALGFMPAFILHDNIKYIITYKNPLYASVIVSLFWLFFEIYNFLGPLLISKPYINNLLFRNKNDNNIFKPKWFNIAYDTFTDVSFFALGAFAYSFYINRFEDKITLFVLFFLFVYLIRASNYWYLTKMYQHYANLPFQIRLSQWDYKIDVEQQNKIYTFITSKNTGKHLLVYGSQFSGKTSLGVSILNELSIKHKVCLYMSAIKLFSFFFVEENTLLNSHRIWSWKETDYLVIDDINPGAPINKELINPENILNFLDPTQIGCVNKESCTLIAEKNIIWILGSECKKANKWFDMLIQIGVQKKNISKINLID